MAQNPNQQNPNQQQAPGGFSTFSQMQKAGVARPPSPSYATQPQSAGAQMYGKPNNPTGFSPQQKPTVQNPLAATTGQGMPQQHPPVAQETAAQQPQQQFHNSLTGNGMATTMGPGTSGGAGFHGGPGEGSPGNGLIPYTGSQQVETVANMGIPQNPVTNPGGPGTQPQVPEAGQPAQNQNWGNTGNQLYQNWQQSQQQIGQNPFQYNNPINQQIGQSVSQNLANPSAYNSQMAMQTYHDTSQQMGQDFDYQRQQLQNMLAKRGLDTSSIHGEKYSDLGTEQARTQANLVHGLTSDAAHQYSTDFSNALNGAMGWGAQDYGQAQGTYGTNQQAQQQQYNQNQQNFQNYVGFGQQDFNNQMDVNQFNANRDDAMNQYLLALMGGIGG